MRPLPTDRSVNGLGRERLWRSRQRRQDQVQGIPTLILFRNGEVVARHEGAIAKPQLKSFLDANL